MQCIYCLEDKSSVCFRSVDHVMPQSFGVFEENFTLKNMVCDTCNGYFGKHLEIFLARDTFEGVARYEHKVKNPQAFKSMGKRSRIIRKVMEGEFQGAYAYLEYSKEQNNLVLKPVPQIGFRKKNSSEYTYFLLDELPDKMFLEQQNFDFTHGQSIRGLACDVTVASTVLSERGITCHFLGEIDPAIDANDNWLCEVTWEIDPAIFRAVAKIGFHYLAYWEGTHFVTHSSFDTIRRYIRHGEKPAYPLGGILDKAILGDEPVEGKRRVGHLVTVDWAEDKVSIVAQISLFNYLTYAVCLARDYAGPHKDIRRGHFFNTHTQEIYALVARDRGLG